MKLFTLIFLSLSIAGLAATRYVDSTATGANNGTSWANAWTSFASITGAAAGDTIYISGGASGGAGQTYTWHALTPGSSGNPITYQIGQDSSHNGVATFNGSGDFVDVGNVVFTGDAGDAVMHFVFSGGTRPIDYSSTGSIHVAYVDFGSRNKGLNTNGGGGGTSSAWEIDHCHFRKIDGGDDFFFYAGLTRGSATWDLHKIHHNTIELIRNTGGEGDDGIQNGSEGISIYNNTITGYTATYTAGQHQDGYQPLLGSYIKVYNNTFVDIANYPVFLDAYYGDFNHVWIYNNIVTLTNSAVQVSDAPQGLVAGPDGGAFGNLGRYPSFDDIIICNNTIADYGGHASINLENNPGQSSVFTNCIVSNNVYINSGAPGIEPGITNAHNISFTSAQAAGKFTTYSVLSGSNNYHLTSSATTLIAAGTDLSAYFSTDAAGVSRGATWDIGAFEYAAGSGSVTATTLNVGTLTLSP